MLATSNVPVWAAEDLFTDGSAAVEAPVVEEPAAEVETFSSEPAEAPAVEEADVNDVATYAATSTLALKDVTWGSAVQLAEGSTLVDNDGNEVKEFTFEWLINGSQPIDENGAPINNVHTTSGGLAGIGASEFFKPHINHVGDSLTLKITGIGANTGFVYETAPVTVKAQNINDIISDGQIGIGDHFNHDYTGKAITVTAADIWVNNASGITSEDFIYTYEGDTVNANAKEEQKGYVIATINKDGFTGSKKIPLNIEPVTTNKDSFDVTLNKKEYEYTGNSITASETDVTVTNNYTGGTVNSAALKGGVEFAGTFKNVGDTSAVKVTNIDVTKDASLNGNVNYHSSSEYVTSDKATVVARQLSNTTIEVTDGLWVPGHTYTEADVRGCITIKDSEGNVLNLGNDINVTVPNITGIGDYQITISGKNSNVIGSVTKTLSIKENTLSNGSFTNGEFATYDEYYTGQPVTKSTSILGQFKVGNVALTEGEDYEIVYSNNTNATGTKLASLTVKGIGDWGGEKTYTFKILAAEIASDTITVPKTVLYDGSKISASDYLEKEDITVKANTKVRNASGALVDTTIDVPAASYDVEFTIDGNTGIPKLNDVIKTTVVNKDANFNGTTAGVKIVAEKGTTISNRSLAEDEAVVEVIGGPYTYTGKPVTPELKVTYNGTELRKDKDYEILTSSNATEAGNATVTVQGIGDYTGTKTVSFTINPANINDVSVTPKKDHDSAFEYTGKQVKPSVGDFDITLNGVDVSANFTIAYPISSYDNVEVGTGKGTLTPLTGNKNFTGGTKAFNFEIQPMQIAIDGTITAWDEDGKAVTLSKTEAEGKSNIIFHYDGTAKEFAKVEFTPTGASKDLKEGVDYEVKYYNNITGPVAAIYVNAIGNYTNKKDQTFSGSEQTYANAAFFGIEGVEVYKENVDVNDTAYGGGITLKPNVTITVGGRNLIEGTDYKFTNIIGDRVNVTPANTTLKATIEFIGGYSNSKDIVIDWKIVAKDIKDTSITASKADGTLNVTVMNGSVQVPAAEYDVKDNGDGTVTVSAKSTSTCYVGSQTVTLEDQDTAIGTPIISEVKVNGNKVEVVLAGECDGATGYDYVISTVNDYQNGRLPNGINKNQLTTTTGYQYIDQGIYYAYCHAWKRVNGVKVFSEWSNIMPFSVSAITPEKPTITSVKKSGRNVTVTWTQCDDAQGYDVVLGTAVRKVNGELRPVEYGKAVKKVGKNTYSVTFKSCPKGATFYAGLHAWNRTSETGVKVFSPWSDSVKVTI